MTSSAMAVWAGKNSLCFSVKEWWVKWGFFFSPPECLSAPWFQKFSFICDNWQQVIVNLTVPPCTSPLSVKSTEQKRNCGQAHTQTETSRAVGFFLFLPFCTCKVLLVGWGVMSWCCWRGQSLSRCYPSASLSFFSKLSQSFCLYFTPSTSAIGVIPAVGRFWQEYFISHRIRFAPYCKQTTSGESSYGIGYIWTFAQPGQCTL